MFYNDRPQIKLGSKWSFDAWGLLLAAGWTLEPATPKTAFLEVPAADGTLDITEVLAGEPRFNNRMLMFGLVLLQPEAEWETIRREVDNYCNGQRMKITLPHDQRHYLMGRISTGTLERQAGSALLPFSVTCDPWRYKNRTTTITLTIPGAGEITGNLRNERRRVLPEITTDGAIDVTINEVTQSISAGTFKFTDFILEPGNNIVEVAGQEGTTVTFEYQEASL